MDLLTALKILIRQWPVVLAGIALTFLGVIQVGNMVDPTYEAKGTVLLLSPGAGNQYLEFPAGLEVTADALVVVMQSPVGGKRMEAAGATGGYSLERTNGPIVDITAKGSTEAEANDTIDIVVEGLKAELSRYQETAAPDQKITLEVLTEPTAKAKLGSRIRAQAATFAILLAATVAAGLAVDAVRRQLREARLRREAEAEADDWEPAVSAGPPGAGYRSPGDPRRAHAPGTLNGAAPAPVLNAPVNGRNGRTSVYPARPAPAHPAPARPPAGASAVPPAPARPPVANGRPAGERRPALESRPVGDAPRRTGDAPRPSGDGRPAGEARPAGEGRPAADEKAADAPHATWP